MAPLSRVENLEEEALGLSRGRPGRLLRSDFHKNSPFMRASSSFTQKGEILRSFPHQIAVQVALGSQPAGPKKDTLFSDRRNAASRLRVHSPSRQVTMSLSWERMTTSLAV